MARYDRSKKPDSQVQQVLDILAEYEAAHPDALIEARRDEYDFISVRVIDPAFQGVYDIDREIEINPLLERLPEKIFCDIMGLVLVTPEEAPHYGPSIEFDHPLPPWPIPNFNEESSTTNGHQNTLPAPSDEMLTLSLEPQEAEAVRQLAQSQGMQDSALIQGWVREKLQLS
ncbi:MAG: hypothetical protein ACPGWR_07450 [Ardenticatenaceae bacterium]